MSLQDSAVEKEGQIPAGDSVQTPPNAAQSWYVLVNSWKKATIAVLPIYIITRLIFIILTYFGGILFFLPNYSPGARSLHDIIFTWNRWDAVRFATIAAQGYIKEEYAAFFPLFPTLSRILSQITHRDPLLCGMVISNLATLGMFVVFYRLVETEFDRDTAKRAVLYLAVFPTALFFFAGYNESLFILLMLLSFYAMRRGSWWLAGLFGGLATLTRSIGLMLIIIFCAEYLRQQLPLFRQVWQEKKAAGLRLFSGLPAILLIPAGLLIYSYGLYQHFGDPLAFMRAQVHWREGLTAPWVAPFLSLKFIVTTPLFGFFTPHNIIDLTAFISFLVLLLLAIWGPERLPRHQWTFILFGLMALIYSAMFPGIPGPNPLPAPYDPLPSMQRFVLEIFVGFIVLARLGRRPWFHEGYLLFSLPMLAFFTLQFITGSWTI
jgi:Gpi18-like mannosyltransferase